MKIEKMLNLFSLMQKNDQLITILTLLIREIKGLVPSTAVAVFVIDDDYSKNVQGIEEQSGGVLFHQRFMLESGKMIDAVSNQPGEIKTCFNMPEDIKYGHKDS